VLATTLSLILLAAAPSLEAETRAFHEKRIAALTREDGWLTIVALDWLAEGENRAGSAAGNEVPFPKDAPPRIGVFTRHGEAITLQAEPGVRVESNRAAVASTTLSIGPEGESQRFTVGRFFFSVIKRGDRLGVRIKDPDASARKSFHGIPMFPPSTAWRIEARFEPAPAGSTIEVQNVLGQIAPFPTPGTAVFSIAGKEYRLTPMLEDEELFFVFGDATNRDATYESGRFLGAAPPKDGKVTLDFNRAINPPCAFTAYATCPLPPRGNKLPLRVEAGEKRMGK
jgi:uncharacterized protein (DUF1684 family)